MHLKKHLLYIISGLLILGLFYFFALSDLFRPQQVAHYENFIGLSADFDATNDIVKAKKSYTELKETASILRGRPGETQKVIALTVDGMSSRDTMETILNILRDKNRRVTFFVEGFNAAHQDLIIQRMVQDKHEIGNYSFVGIDKAERLDPDRLIEQFCRTQKAIELTAGTQPSLFKLPNTRYLEFVLRAAKASGLQSAVQNDLTISASALTAGSIPSFAAKVKPGLIVSIELGHVVPLRFSKKTQNDMPAIDLKPTIKDGSPLPENNMLPIAQSIGQFCDLLEKEGYKIITIQELTQQKY